MRVELFQKDGRKEGGFSFGCKQTGSASACDAAWCFQIIMLSHGPFASLIICLFYFIFLVGTVFFFHSKSVGTVFWLFFQRSERDHRSFCLMYTR